MLLVVVARVRHRHKHRQQDQSAITYVSFICAFTGMG